MDNKSWAILAICLCAIFLIGGIVIAATHCDYNTNFDEKEIATNAVNFINTKLLQNETAILVNQTMEHGLVKFTIDIDGEFYVSYITSDEELLFPAGVDAIIIPKVV